MLSFNNFWYFHGFPSFGKQMVLMYRAILIVFIKIFFILNLLVFLTNSINFDECNLSPEQKKTVENVRDQMKDLPEFNEEKYETHSFKAAIQTNNGYVTFHEIKGSGNKCVLKRFNSALFNNQPSIFLTALYHGLQEKDHLITIKNNNVPYVVQYEEAYKKVDDDELVIELKYLPGETLLQRHYITKKNSGTTSKRFNGESFGSDNLICENVARLAVALAHMRSLNILYGNIKHENIIVGNEDKFYLTDFSSSQVLNEGEVLPNYYGSLHTSPPEYLDNKGIDFAADVWGLGILLWNIYYPDSKTQNMGPFGHNCHPNYCKGNHDVQEVKTIMKEKMNKKDEIELLKENFDSKSLRDLLTGMLTKDPRSRLTILEVIDHRWFQKNGDGAKEVIKQFKTTDAYHKLKLIPTPTREKKKPNVITQLFRKVSRKSSDHS